MSAQSLCDRSSAAPDSNIKLDGLGRTCLPTLELHSARRETPWYQWLQVHAKLHGLREFGRNATVGVQVVACEIEEFMRDFAQPWFERAGVAHKVLP